MTKKLLVKHFEKKYLAGTCFDSLQELLADKTDIQINAVRALIAMELCGVWRGLQELLDVSAQGGARG